MKYFVLALSIIAFVFSCFIGGEHSHASDESHYCFSSDQSDGYNQNNSEHNCNNVEKVDLEDEIIVSCDCCGYSHCLAMPIHHSKIDMASNSKQQLSWYSDIHYSADRFRLKRPPRV